jgi:hypothetical protein
MTTIRNAGKAAPAAAVVTALASLACCLPWGIGALLGSAGLGLAFERHRPWLIALSLIFLALGGYSLLHTSRSCRRLPKAFTFFLLTRCDRSHGYYGISRLDSQHYGKSEIGSSYWPLHRVVMMVASVIVIGWIFRAHHSEHFRSTCAEKSNHKHHCNREKDYVENGGVVPTDRLLSHL